MMHANEIITITIVTSILIMTSGTGISSSRAFAQNDSETDLDNLTLTNTSEMQVDTTLTNGSGVQGDTSGVELPQQQPPDQLSPSTPTQQQPQGPLSPP
jgi:hypothetical protein